MARLDVGRLLDERPLTPLQIRVFALCAVVALLDGADSQSIGVAAPLIAADLHMRAGAMAPALSAGLLGAAIGALAFGPLADRMGRKPMLVLTTAWFGFFTCLTALAGSFDVLLVCRFLAGLGLGGATPCFITMAAEYAPNRNRAMLASLLWAGYPLGNSLGGFMTSYVVTHYSWHYIFYIGGIPTLIVAVILAIAMPESLRFLASRGKQAEAEKLARRLDPALPPGPLEIEATLGRQTKARLSDLFRQGRAAGTLTLWLIFYLAFATTTVIVLMTPSLLRAGGVPVGTSAMLVGVYSLAAMFGMAIAGKLVEKFGPIVALAPAFVLGAVLLAALGLVTHSIWLAALCMALLGFTVPLGASGGIALAATFYPTVMRSSGVGWAMGLGRFGQVCSPLITGQMLLAGWPPMRILAVMAVAPFLAGLVVLLRTLLLRGATRAPVPAA